MADRHKGVIGVGAGESARQGVDDTGLHAVVRAEEALVHVRRKLAETGVLNQLGIVEQFGVLEVGAAPERDDELLLDIVPRDEALRIGLPVGESRDQRLAVRMRACRGVRRRSVSEVVHERVVRSLVDCNGGGRQRGKSKNKSRKRQ